MYYLIIELRANTSIFRVNTEFASTFLPLVLSNMSDSKKSFVIKLRYNCINAINTTFESLIFSKYRLWGKY